MIRIGFAELCMDFIDNPERIFELHNQNEADSFCDAVSLVRLPFPDPPEDDLSRGDSSRGDAGADVILSRGFDSKPLARRYPGVPIVELRLTACELYHDLEECRERFGSRKTAVVLPDGMLPRAELLAEALGLGARFYNLAEDSDRRAILARAMGDGCDCVLSGRTVCRLAGELGVDSLLISPREDSVYSSITRAKRLALRARRTRELPRERCIVFDHTALAIRKPDAKRTRLSPKRHGGNVLFYPEQSEPSVQSGTPNA